MPEDRSSFDILLALLSRGLEPVVTSLVLGRLTNSDLRRCCRVSRGWRAAARAAWEREDRKRNSKNCKSRSTLLQCHRERAVCTVSDVVGCKRELHIFTASLLFPQLRFLQQDCS